MRRTNWLSTCAIVLALGACGQKAPPLEQVAPIAIPPPPKVADLAGPYVLRYFSPTSGELKAVRTPAEVPQGARAQVVVSPEDPNLAGTWLYVADLTKKEGDSYAVRSVDRAELELQIAKAHPPAPPVPAAKAENVAGRVASGSAAPSAATAGDSDVVIYRTVWCGYCKKAAEYLRLKGVPFVEKDLERDAGAREDMLARARKAGVPQSKLEGVPILSVRGHIITGFDRAAIDAALRG